MTATKATSKNEPISAWERRLRNQLPLLLPPDELAAFKRELRGIPTSEARAEHIANRFGDDIESPPVDEELALYAELAQMARACRDREHGVKSHQNLAHYIACRFLPELMSFPDSADDWGMVDLPDKASG